MAKINIFNNDMVGYVRAVNLVIDSARTKAALDDNRQRRSSPFLRRHGSTAIGAQD